MMTSDVEDTDRSSESIVFERFLAVNWKSIKVLHYVGTSISELKKVLKVCAQNLECLSLWRLNQSRISVGSSNGLYEKDEESKLIFPKLKNIILVSYEDGMRYFRMGLTSEYIGSLAAKGICSPSEDFLIDILRSSPSLDSLSCKLSRTSVLEALTRTNSYMKLTSLCLKSRVGIPQLRSLVSAKMRLKVLCLEGLCVAMYSSDYYYRWDNTGRRVEPDKTHDTDVMEFAPLVLTFLKSQASTLEYLKLNLFTDRNRYDRPEVSTDALLNHFPHMPNLITFVVGCFDSIGTLGFPFNMPTFAELFPKLKNLKNIPHLFCREDDHHWSSHIYYVRAAGEIDEDFPPNYPVSPNASFSLENILNIKISPNLAQMFPFITEFHYDRNIRYLHRIPFYLPRLKHFYHVVNVEESSDEYEILEMIQILNVFMIGISREECEMAEGDLVVEDLNQVQFARSRPSIFDLKDLETLDFKFSYECKSHGGIIPALEVLISWGLSRMTHLKKLRFQFEQKVKVNSGSRLPASCGTLLEAFGNRNNLETHSQCREMKSRYGWPEKTHLETKWNFELNLKHHTSEWDQLNFFSEDSDFWDFK